MNPGSDVGKKELPPNIRKKFTTINIHEMEDHGDIANFIGGLLKGVDLG
jgi:midasin